MEHESNLSNVWRKQHDLRLWNRIKATVAACTCTCTSAWCWSSGPWPAFWLLCLQCGFHWCPAQSERRGRPARSEGCARLFSAWSRALTGTAVAADTQHTPDRPKVRPAKRWSAVERRRKNMSLTHSSSWMSWAIRWRRSERALLEGKMKGKAERGTISKISPTAQLWGHTIIDMGRPSETWAWKLLLCVCPCLWGERVPKCQRLKNIFVKNWWWRTQYEGDRLCGRNFNF